MLKSGHKSVWNDERFFPWLIRVPAVLIMGGVLVLLVGRINQFGSAVIYATSWLIFLHVLIGEHVFIRYLHAVSRIHQLLDAFAGLLLLSGFFSFRRSALWCAFMAGAFALAIVKYLLVEKNIQIPALKRYAREKILWESPAVCLFSILAVVIDRLPSDGVFVRFAEMAILAAAALFAVWMIGVRHMYRRVAESRRDEHSQP